jgi:diamine N-acetyltransferase
MPETINVTCDSPVTLREITEETVRSICRLSDTLTDAQRHAVADNAVSIAQAHFNKYAWFRAIYADETPVGFIMLYDNAEEPEYVLWRMMIGGPYQGLGIGAKAIHLLEDYVRARPGAKQMLVSCVEGESSPIKFYEKLGFVRTGDRWDEEIVLALAL